MSSSLPTTAFALQAQAYRFGFQGQACPELSRREKDNEWTGTEGSHLAFKYRVHDARIGRFLSIDPLTAKYPHNSPYAFSENSVIAYRELEGLEKVFYAHINFNDGRKMTIRIIDDSQVKTTETHVNYFLDENNEVERTVISPTITSYDLKRYKSRYFKNKNPKGVHVWAEGARDDGWTVGPKTDLSNVKGTFNLTEFQELVAPVLRGLAGRKENSIDNIVEGITEELKNKGQDSQEGNPNQEQNDNKKDKAVLESINSEEGIQVPDSISLTRTVVKENGSVVITTVKYPIDN
ncbi:MAG: hypothetical protein PF692_11925 [Kiritimatiellae bacterium]|jgi:hypothetical protein|nr:hypothetical protein [Kiritimatiellia bacterium]